MSNLLGILHSASSGMSASQRAIQTTSHNITNLNTPGYSRQRVEQTANRPFSQPGLNSNLGAGQLGTGVQVTDITRIRNTFYDFQFRNESHTYGDISLKYDYYKNMEIAFNEPSDNAISSSLNKFFNGWNELSKDPNNMGVKNVVIENARYLANNINKVNEKITSLQENLDKQSGEILGEINQKLEALKELDKNIKIVEATGKSPNDLLDERDRILDDLSFKINISDKDVQNTIKTVMGEGRELKMEDLKDLMDNNKLSGELQATGTMKGELNKYRDQLQELAKTIAESVNSTYKNGDDTKGDLFVFDGTSDKVLTISKEIEDDASKLEVSSDLALEMYKLKDKKLTFGEPPNEKSMTINTFYNNIVQDLGQASQTVIRQEKNQSTLLSSIDNARVSISGVSMDEEMVNLVQLQHAYNASAKVVSTIDSLLDVVINGLMR